MRSTSSGSNSSGRAAPASFKSPMVFVKEEYTGKKFTWGSMSLRRKEPEKFWVLKAEMAFRYSFSASVRNRRAVTGISSVRSVRDSASSSS